MNKLHKKLLIIAPLLMVSILVASLLPDIMTFAQPSANQEHAINATKPTATNGISTQSVETISKSGVSQTIAGMEEIFVSHDDAKQIALKKVTGEIVEFELDDEKYQIEIHAEGKEYDITIDAYTGNILSFETDEKEDKKLESLANTTVSNKRL